MHLDFSVNFERINAQQTQIKYVIVIKGHGKRKKRYQKIKRNKNSFLFLNYII